VPARVSDQVLEQIRHANDVVEVIGSYFPLKRAGANFRTLCPFHKEKTPSFNVNPAKQIWHCFGCGAGGDVFKFVMQYENLEFLDAVRRLAERAGIRIEWEEAAGEPSRDQKDALLKLHELAANFFHENLLKNKAAEPARTYLKKRKLDVAIAKRWRLGYSLDSWDALIRWAATKKFPVELLETAGLALKREQEDGHYDRFRGRLMFPICDEQGRVVGFSGRILTDAKDQPKYVNSPETPIFQKGKILFALDKARRSIIEEKFAVVCEGQLDAISCHEAGIANAVAPQGTALTEQHARILKRYAEEVVLMFDADMAGQDAIVRSAEPLWQAGIALRVAVMPQGHDPDSFVKAFGPEQLKEIITKGDPFFVYLLERLSKQHDPRTDRGKLQIARQIAEWLVRIPSPILLSSYAQQTASRLGVPEDAVRQVLRKLQVARRGFAVPVEDVAESDAVEVEPTRPAGLAAETMLLQLMLTEERAVEFVTERLDREWLTGSIAGSLIERIAKIHAKGDWDGPKKLLNQVSGEEESRLIAELALTSPVKQGLEAALGDCLGTLERQWAARHDLELRNSLRRTDLGSKEREQIQRQILDLQPKLRNIPALSMRKTDSSGR
jgi:DNA primase